MNQTINFAAMSRDWLRYAEECRKTGTRGTARYCLRRHIELREKARTIAKRAKAVKP